MNGIKFKSWKFSTLVLCLVFCVSIAFSQIAVAQYLKVGPEVPDVNKSGVSPDNSCWMATAANMLAGAGYGNGNTLQDRAEDIYQDMVTMWGVGSGGWIDDGLNDWLSSAYNVWPSNPYNVVTMYGSYSKVPVNDSGLPMDVANELRDCQMLGLSISWDYSGHVVPGYGGHAITCWGDNNPSPDPIAANPTQVIVADSDDGVSGEQTYNYTWQAYTNAGSPTNGWEMSYSGTPFIKHYTTLCKGAVGYRARGTKSIHQDNDITATDLHFRAYQKESWVEILSYRHTIDVPYTDANTFEDDYPQSDGKIHSINVDYYGLNVPYCTWVTIDVEFILSSFNTVRFEDVYFTYPTIDPETGNTIIAQLPVAYANVDWFVVSYPRNLAQLDLDQNQYLNLVLQRIDGGGTSNYYNLSDSAYSYYIPTSYQYIQPVKAPSTIGTPTYDQPPESFFDVIFGEPPSIPQKGYLIAQYDVLDVNGTLKTRDKIMHEFKTTEMLEPHTLIVENKNSEPAIIQNVRYGISEGYLTKRQLESFNNWTNTIQGQVLLEPGQRQIYQTPLNQIAEVETIEPKEAEQGATLNVTITGNNFMPESQLSFLGEGINVISTNVVSPRDIVAEIAIASKAEEGVRAVLVTNPGRNPAVLHDGLEITRKPPVTPPTPPTPTKPLPYTFPGIYNYSPQTYYQSPPTYNNFNYSPVTTIGLPMGTYGGYGGGLYSAGYGMYPGLSSSLSTGGYPGYSSLPTIGYRLGSSINGSPFSYAVNPYNTLVWNFGGIGGGGMPISFIPVGMGAAAGNGSNTSTWSYVSYETTSVIGNSPHISNYTFGADYDRVNIDINSNQSYILNY